MDIMLSTEMSTSRVDPRVRSVWSDQKFYKFSEENSINMSN